MTSGRARASPGRGTELRYKVPMSLAKISSPWPLWIFIQPNICILNISLEIYGYKEINIVGYVCMYIYIHIYIYILYTHSIQYHPICIYIYIESSIIQCVYVYIYIIYCIYNYIYMTKTRKHLKVNSSSQWIVNPHDYCSTFSCKRSKCQHNQNMYKQLV